MSIGTEKLNIPAFDIPEGIIELPKKPCKINLERDALVLCDIHFPFHDKKAIETALDYKDNPECIILLGDLFDFYALSRFKKRPDRPFIKDEIDTGKKFFAYLRERFPKTQIIYYLGNHDTRFESYIWEKAPALFGLEAVKLESLLELHKHNVTVIQNGEGIKVTSLHLLHGNEAGMSGGGINVGRSMSLKTYDNCAFGHFHKTQQSPPLKTLDGRYYFNWSIGCLCQLKPPYLPINTWTQGFARIEVYKNEFELSNRLILPNYNVR